MHPNPASRLLIQVVGILVLWISESALAAEVEQITPPQPPGTKTIAILPPAPTFPKPKNPVDTLRQVLSMTDEQRTAWLAQKSESARRIIQEKVKELESLPPAQREFRLRLLQLRFYLLPLMQLSAEQRAGKLEEVPVAERPLVEERLREWDQLPEDHQKELLQNESSLRQLPFFPANRVELASKPNPPPASTPARQADLARWKSYPPEKQERILKNFERFFELKPELRQKALSALAPADRTRLEGALARFADLPANQRAKCVEAYERFVSMGEEERENFLNHAAKWNAMTSEERRAWKLLTSQLPPSPPGLPGGMPLPPTPPAAKPLPQGSLTNVQLKH